MDSSSGYSRNSGCSPGVRVWGIRAPVSRRPSGCGSSLTRRPARGEQARGFPPPRRHRDVRPKGRTSPGSHRGNAQDPVTHAGQPHTATGVRISALPGTHLSLPSTPGGPRLWRRGCKRQQPLTPARRPSRPPSTQAAMRPGLGRGMTLAAARPGPAVTPPIAERATRRRHFPLVCGSRLRAGPAQSSFSIGLGAVGRVPAVIGQRFSQ